MLFIREDIEESFRSFTSLSPRALGVGIRYILEKGSHVAQIGFKIQILLTLPP